MGAVFTVVEYYLQTASLPPTKFSDEELARGEAERLSARGEVLLFKVCGEPRYNLWGEPRLIARFGSANAAVGRDGLYRPDWAIAPRKERGEA